jgi:hypothetical protein
MKTIFLLITLILISFCVHAQKILIKSKSTKYQTSFHSGTVVKIKVKNLLENENLNLVVDSISSDSFYGHQRKLPWIQVTIPLNEIRLLKFKSSVNRNIVRITFNSLLIPFTSLMFFGYLEEESLLGPFIFFGSVISLYNISYIKRRFNTEKYTFSTIK